MSARRPRPDRCRPAAAAAAVVGAVLTTVLLGGCASGDAAASAGPGARPVLTMWSHDGTEAEAAALREVVERFNATSTTARVEVVPVPEGDYGQVVQTAIVAGTLPDLLEVDGPLVPSYAYQGALLPLDGHLDGRTVERMLPSLRAQGSYGGDLYAVGMFESGLGLFADRDRLDAAGVRVPTGLDDAWDAQETTDALRRLAADDPDGLVLDVKRSYGVGEWLTYGFAPLVWSAGGDLLDRGTGTAVGTLDSPDAVRALDQLGRWSPYVDEDPDGGAFVERDVALSWVGHWEYPRYAEALGGDLVVLPLPDLGRGSRSTHGSWAWAAAAGTAHPEQAVAVLEHLLSDRSVGTMTAANGAVPGTWAVMQRDERYAPGGPLHVYAESLTRACPAHPVAGCLTGTRPATPGYPTLTYAFAAAVEAVLDGGDAAAALQEAAATVDADVRANRGYGTPVAQGGRVR